MKALDLSIAFVCGIGITLLAQAAWIVWRWEVVGCIVFVACLAGLRWAVALGARDL